MSTIPIFHECRRNNVMIKHTYDFDDRNFTFSVFNDIFIYTDWYMMMRMNGNMVEAVKNLVNFTLHTKEQGLSLESLLLVTFWSYWCFTHSVFKFYLLVQYY